MADKAWCRLCLNNKDASFSAIEGECLDLVISTLGRLALSISPSLNLPPPLICKLCEASLLKFKIFKVMVQTNIQLIIDNKESIQKYGLSSLELRSTATSREKVKCDGQSKSAKADVVEDFVDQKERYETVKDANDVELDKIFDKEHILKPKEEYVAADNDDQERKYKAYVKLEKKAKRRRYKAKPGYCRECQRKYADLSAHRSQIHIPKPALKCSLCNKVFLGNKLLDTHVKRHSQPTIPCLKCGTKIKEGAMRKHLTYKHKEVADIKCTFTQCDKLFKQPQTLKNHIKLVHEKQRVLCVDCGASVSNLFLHRMKCFPDGKSAEKVACNLCQKTFCSKQFYEYHERTVHISVRACNLCGQKVKDLERHEQNIHGEQEKSNKCPEPDCGKEFKTKLQLKRHNDAVHLQLREQCPKCEKWFTVTHLKTHIRKLHKPDPELS